MKYLILFFTFLFLATPVHGLEVKLTYKVKSPQFKIDKSKRDNMRWIRFAGYRETNQLWTEFVKRANRISEEMDYPLSVLLGQAALESARGTSHYAQTRHNFFGIGAYDSNPDQAFSYEDLDAGIRGYISLISNDKRYAEAYSLKDKPYEMIQAIKNAGYATDPYYVSKVINLPEFIENL